MDKKTFWLKKKSTVAILACFCCLLWGSAFPSIKIGYKLFNISGSDTGSQILFAGIRFTLAGILVLITGSFLQKKFLIPKKKSILNVFKLSLVQTVLQYLFFYIGLAHAAGITASIVEASNVFFAILVSALIFHFEKLSSNKIIGCILGFLGVILINLSGNSVTFHMSFNGEGFILLSALSYSFSAVMIKKYSQIDNPVTLSGWQFTSGGIILAFAGYLYGGRINMHVSAEAFILLIYLAFISATAYTIWGILLKYNPVGDVSIYGFMNPICGVILSALFLNESGGFSIISVIALLLVCTGIWIVNKE